MVTLSTGDTVPGFVRFRKKDLFGNLHTILSGIETDRLDKSGSTGDLLINPQVGQLLVENQRVGRSAIIFEQQEILVVELKGSLASEVVDYNAAGDVAIAIRKQEMNRKTLQDDQLTSADQDLTADVTVLNSAYISVFEAKVPVGERWILSGIQKFAAIST